MFTMSHPPAVAEVRDRAVSDLWAYFDEMALDLDDQRAPAEAVEWAEEWRDAMEALLNGSLPENVLPDANAA